MIFKIVRRITWLAIGPCLAYMAWPSSGSSDIEPDKKLGKMANASVERIVIEIQQNRGAARHVVLPRFANDSLGVFTMALRNKLKSSGVLDVAEESIKDSVLGKMNVRPEECANRDQALAIGRNEKSAYVLWGVLDRFEATRESAVLAGRYQLLDVQSGQAVCEGNIVEGDADEPHTATSYSPKGVIVFALTVFLFPIITIAFLRKMVAKRSNGVNAFLLCVYTGIDAMIWHSAVGLQLATVFAAVVFLAIILGCLVYNAYIMSFALKFEEK